MKRWLIIAMLLGMASPATAHHIKGLPHFGYKDMGWYPQIPSKETVRQLKEHLVIATTMPGDPKAGSQVNIHLYIKELSTKRPLQAPIMYGIERKKLFFFKEEIKRPTGLKPILELYQIATTFQKGGDYALCLTLPNGSTTRIPIEVSP